MSNGKYNKLGLTLYLFSPYLYQRCYVFLTYLGIFGLIPKYTLDLNEGRNNCMPRCATKIDKLCAMGSPLYYVNTCTLHAVHMCIHAVYMHGETPVRAHMCIHVVYMHVS